jgi:hypothetical protein
MDGFHLALLIGGGVLLLAALVANRFIPGRAEAPRPSEEPAILPVEV